MWPTSLNVGRGTPYIGPNSYLFSCGAAATSKLTSAQVAKARKLIEQRRIG
jgi:hypothetical protein